MYLREKYNSSNLVKEYLRNPFKTTKSKVFFLFCVKFHILLASLSYLSHSKCLFLENSHPEKPVEFSLK